MPELPEVECLTRAMAKILEGGVIKDVRFLRPDLRRPIPQAGIHRVLCGQTVEKVYRRSKYLLVKTMKGHGIFHLGMTGNMFFYSDDAVHRPHTHALLEVAVKAGEHGFLHFVDPRRFGMIDYCEGPIEQHALMADLGPEPLACRELDEHLWRESRRRTQAIKSFIMDQHVVVGVGNIYASEALFLSGIRPSTPALRVSRERYLKLAGDIKIVLKNAIKAGGTSFRDYRHADGAKGYFQVSLAVYGRAGEPCTNCRTPIKEKRLGGRSSFFCPSCQK